MAYIYVDNPDAKLKIVGLREHLFYSNSIRNYEEEILGVTINYFEDLEKRLRVQIAKDSSDRYALPYVTMLGSIDVVQDLRNLISYVKKNLIPIGLITGGIAACSSGLEWQGLALSYTGLIDLHILQTAEDLRKDSCLESRAFFDEVFMNLDAIELIKKFYHYDFGNIDWKEIASQRA